jgi:hypothetical protein
VQQPGRAGRARPEWAQPDVEQPDLGQSPIPPTADPPADPRADAPADPPVDPVIDPVIDRPADLPAEPPADPASHPVAQPPLPPEQKDSTRLITVTTVVSWLAALVLMTVTVMWLVTREGPPPAGEPRADRADGVTRVPEAPVPLPGDAAYTQVSVLPGDVLAVKQWLTDSSGFSHLSVVAPGGQVRAESFQVYADGLLVEQRATVDGRVSNLDLGGATAVYLRYTLFGALERTHPPPGRALARVTSLDLSYDAWPGPTTIAFRGAKVLALACQPTRTSAPPLPCGVEEGGRWRVEPPPGQVDYRVMAQLDLEPGGA